MEACIRCLLTWNSSVLNKYIVSGFFFPVQCRLQLLDDGCDITSGFKVTWGIQKPEYNCSFVILIHSDSCAKLLQEQEWQQVKDKLLYCISCVARVISCLPVTSQSSFSTAETETARKNKFSYKLATQHSKLTWWFVFINGLRIILKKHYEHFCLSAPLTFIFLLEM